RGFVFEVPAGLIRSDEPLELTAVVRDADGASGRHTIQLVGARDDILPDVAVTQPAVGFGPPEGSVFSLGYRAFDNVKVEQVELFTALGVRLADGSYHQQPFGSALASQRAIEARDFLPVTTVNIDTPEFLQAIRTPRLAEFIAAFPGLGLTGSELFSL